MKIIAISGMSNSGKDTAADFLVKNHNFCKISFADEMKRIVKNLYPKITYEQLWGPSEKRNEPLLDYPTNKQTFDNCIECGNKLKLYLGFWTDKGIERFECDIHGKVQFYLTTRYLLQSLNILRECYSDTYVDFTMNDILHLCEGRNYQDNRGIYISLINKRYDGVVIPDNRWPNSNGGAAVRAAGGVLLRMKRGEGMKGSAGQHESETLQNACQDEFFDYVADNREWSLEQVSDYMDFIVKDMDNKNK